MQPSLRCATVSERFRQTYDCELNLSQQGKLPSQRFLAVCTALSVLGAYIFNSQLNAVVRFTFEDCMQHWDGGQYGDQYLVPVSPSTWAPRTDWTHDEPFSWSRQVQGRVAANDKDYLKDRTWKAANCPAVNSSDWERCRELNMYDPLFPEATEKVILKYLYPLWSQNAPVCNFPEFAICHQKLLNGTEGEASGNPPAWWITRMQHWTSAVALAEEKAWMQRAPIITIRENACVINNLRTAPFFKVAVTAQIVSTLLTLLAIRPIRKRAVRVSIGAYAALMVPPQIAGEGCSRLKKRCRKIRQQD